ncbi:MAG TPA: dihydrodipicolinate synthase family protein [Gemmataceae bacterium]|nr:dihydrodipicolinate synthase family protein [Gemmataceae bacterium]
MSAILLPFEHGEVDWHGFHAHVGRTARAGLVPAVNMDTGYGNLLDVATRRRVLLETFAAIGGPHFIAGAFVADHPGDAFNLDAYRRAIDAIQKFGGLPIIFQSHGLVSLAPDRLLDAYRAFGRDCPRYYAFELGQAFAPFGAIYPLETYAGLLDIPACIGAKHSSLNRVLEWQRLMLRDQRRPDFLVLTGNDLAIDMIMYGSDYLLGLSTFAPDLFARRDALWEAGDPAFLELNDLLQYLGFFAFRPPVPAYKHSAAQFLKLRGWINHDHTHPQSPQRPESDRDVLRDIAERLAVFGSEENKKNDRPPPVKP